MNLNIGKVKLDNPFILAPMAGVNCTSFRLMCKEAGAGLLYTQMYHSDFVMHKYDKEGKQAVYDFINIQDDEKTLAVCSKKDESVVVFQSLCDF